MPAPQGDTEQTDYAYYIFALLLSFEFNFDMAGGTGAQEAYYAIQKCVGSGDRWPDFRPAIYGAEQALRRRYDGLDQSDAIVAAGEALIDLVATEYRTTLDN